MLNFASESSTHGLSFIFGENRSKFVRVLWVFLFFASFCGFSYYFKLAYTKWSVAPDITIKISNKQNNEFPFPAITYCPMLFSRANQVDFNKYYDAAQANKIINATQAECEYLYANLYWGGGGTVTIFMNLFCKEHFTKLEELNIMDVVNRSTYSIEELFNKKISNKLTRVIMDNGFCFTYNMQDFSAIFSENIHDDFKCYKNQKHPEIEWNVERGYFSENSTYPENASKRTLTFATMMNPIDAKNSLSKTIFVYIHHPNELPSDFNLASLPLKYGSQNHVEITVKSHRTNENLRSYSPDIRKCYFDGERKLELFKTYTKSHCILECRSNEVISACGCVKFNMPRNKTTRVCHLSDINCFLKQDVMLKVEDYRACGCLPSCNDIQYAHKINELNLDPKIYNVDRNDSIATMWMITSEDSNVEEIEYFLTYTLLHYVGGLLGLFVGCSFLSIAEFFFFFFASLIKAFKNRIGKQEEATEDLKNLFLRIDKLFVRIEKLEKNSVKVENSSPPHKKENSLFHKLSVNIADNFQQKF